MTAEASAGLRLPPQQALSRHLATSAITLARETSMRRSAVVLLLVSLAGVLGGAFLVGTWMVGLAVMADSLLLGLWALFRDDGRPEPEPPSVHEVATLDTILERARQAR